MEFQDERRVKRLLRRLVGLCQGLHPKDGGGRLRAFCQATRRKYSTVVNKLNLGRTHTGRGIAVVDIGLLVDVCRHFRDARPVQLLGRLASVLPRRRRHNPTIEVAA